MKRSDQNETRQKLDGLPFKTVAELKKEEDVIRLHTWRRLQQAKIIDELTKRDDFKFWRDEFETGLSCVLGGDKEGQLFRVFGKGSGMKIEINPNFTQMAESSVVESLVKSVSQSFATTYYQAKGFLTSDANLEEVIKPG